MVKSGIIHTSADTKANRRALLLTYHFPPGNAVGAMRWEKFSRYFSEHDWAIDVIADHPNVVSAEGKERLASLPPGVRVYGVPTTPITSERLINTLWGLKNRLRAPAAGHDPGTTQTQQPVRATSLPREEIRWRLGSLHSWKSAYVAWGDYANGMRWARDVMRTARREFVTGTHSVVISCGPPHLVHEAARRIAKRTGIPFVMDMRDPWSLVQRLPITFANPLWYRYAKKYEQRVIATASMVVANTDKQRSALARLYPEAANKIITVMNGYDDEPLPEGKRQDRFTALYAGTIYLDRDPRPLFDAASKLVAEMRVRPEDFQVLFVGDVATYGGVSTRQLASEAGIGEFFDVKPRMPREEVYGLMAGAHLLVLLPQDSDMAVPAKLYEYCRFDSSVLALAKQGSSVEAVLRGSGASVVDPHDVDGMFNTLKSAYMRHLDGSNPERVHLDQKFSRGSQANVFLDALDDRLGWTPEPT